jgi:hypothetical protein
MLQKSLFLSGISPATSDQQPVFFSGRKGMGAALIFQFVAKEFLRKIQGNLRMGKTDGEAGFFIVFLYKPIG